MFNGTLEAIHLGATHGAEPKGCSSAVVVEGVGLEGDRYGTARTRKQKTPKAGFEGEDQITLIEAEALEALTRDEDLRVTAAQTRRNLLVRGVPLNHLVGRRFRVGVVVLEGVRLCEPCGHLEALVGLEVREPLLHRGGLRARVIGGGTIHIGDAVVPA